MQLGQIRIQNSFVRVWGAPFRTAEGKRRGGHTWWMLDAGKGVGEDLTNGAAARPVVAARRPGKEDQGRRGTEKRESGGRNRDEPARVLASRRRCCQISTGDKIPGVMGLTGLGFYAQENHCEVVEKVHLAQVRFLSFQQKTEFHFP